MELKAYLNEESLGSALGIEKDVDRETFFDEVKVLEKENINVQVFDALKNKEDVKDIEVLPSFEVNGEIKISGRYPSKNELSEMFDIDICKFGSTETSSFVKAANDNQVGYCCGVGTDIYLDPNEEE